LLVGQKNVNDQARDGVPTSNADKPSTNNNSSHPADETKTETTIKRRSKSQKEQTAKNLRFHNGAWKFVISEARWQVRHYVATQNAFPASHMEMELLCGEWLSTSKANYAGDPEDLSDGEVSKSIFGQLLT
jgi:hypothetical protein